MALATRQDAPPARNVVFPGGRYSTHGVEHSGARPGTVSTSGSASDSTNATCAPGRAVVQREGSSACAGLNPPICLEISISCS